MANNATTMLPHRNQADGSGVPTTLIDLVTSNASKPLSKTMPVLRSFGSDDSNRYSPGCKPANRVACQPVGKRFHLWDVQRSRSQFSLS